MKRNLFIEQAMEKITSMIVDIEDREDREDFSEVVAMLEDVHLEFHELEEAE